MFKREWMYGIKLPAISLKKIVGAWGGYFQHD
jgi:hypothetical protein